MKAILLLTLILSANVAFSAQESVSLVDAKHTIQEVLISESQTDLKVALSCVCYGGPGNYRYECPPVAKLCQGGPGNYTYTCYVCP